MKILFDLLPILLFFIAFKVSGIYVATGVAIVATAALIGWTWLKTRKVDPMQWVSLGLIVVFGGATIWLQDETFIKWKPTILYWLFAIVFLVSNQFMNKNLVRSMMGHQVDLPAAMWSRLNTLWICFFAIMGGLNLAVAYNFDTDTWVSFKLFGGMGLMLLFVLAQGLYMAKHLPKEGTH
ncbi:MAG: septation protein A [Rhodocyclales bacterium]|nr:septation protein A [Rhodocyclales bacterium]